MNYDDKIVKVAEILGGEPQPVSEFYGPESRGHRVIALPGLHKWAGIMMRFGQYRLEGKFGISFAHTKALNNYFLPRGQSHLTLNGEIKVSAQKKPEHIARDIQRRLLPGYLEWLQAMEVAVEETDNATRARTDIAEGLRDILTDAGLVHRTRHNDEFTAYCYSDGRFVDARVNSNHTIRIETEVDYEQAKQIFAIIVGGARK